MRAIYSYIVAGVILLIGAIWLGSGVLVTGGKGPGNGETPIVDLVSGQKPADSALQTEAEKKAAEAEAAAKAAADAKTEAETAAKELRAADTKDKREELEAELKHKQEALETAQKEADAAAAAFAAAEEQASKVKGELDAVKTIVERTTDSQEAMSLQSVRTQTFAMQPFEIEAPLRGSTQAKSVVTVTPETSGRVTSVKVAKGDHVTAGQVLCTIDEGVRAAAVAQAEAGLAQAQLQYDTNAELRKKGLAAANTAAQFEASLKSAQAAYDQAVTELGRTLVKTEVAGVVQEPIATVGGMLSAGSVCATVVELDPMLFVGSVPEVRMSLARTGLDAEVTTVTGATAKGKVTYLASVADASTRSFPVEIELPNPDGKLLSGLTATAVVKLSSVPAHLLPQSVLTLDDDGVLGVRAVADSVVKFYPVTILSDSRQGVWVTGLPATVDVITVGQDFVTAGQTVDATNVTADTAATSTSGEGAAS